MEHGVTAARTCGNRAVRHRLAIDVAPGARHGVVPAEVVERARRVLRLQAAARRTGGQEPVVVVLDQRRGRTHAAARWPAQMTGIDGAVPSSIGPLHVEAAVVAIDEVGAHRAAAAELTADAGRRIPRHSASRASRAPAATRRAPTAFRSAAASRRHWQRTSRTSAESPRRSRRDWPGRC